MVSQVGSFLSARRLGRVRKSPQRHRMDHVNAYMVIRKR